MEGDESKHSKEAIEETSLTNAKKETKQTVESEKQDEELDSLLDSALKDFDEIKPKTATKDDQSSAKKNDTASQKTEASGDPLSDMFAEEFSDDMAKQFEEAMKSMVGEDPELVQQIEKLAAAAGSAGDSQEAQQEFAKNLAQTMSSLDENSEELQGQMSEDDLMKAFTSMGMEDGQDGFMPMMQGMMKSLLSKEILYPSLKELSKKYPHWLDENKDKTAKDQLDKYLQQQRIVGEICEEFETEQPSETDERKKLRFERIIDLMQQMQDLGQPPKEIVGDMAPGLDFDENGLPKLPGTQQGCSIM
ncbi:peroxisomal biogenesis factor 19-like [Mytilus californianus]|uniref:peroxisomal biogenesis factor 19-like n=1 Tax=Mytilus californianus TaxID=6549 RepID=UPI0022474A09|nr:peroxisomal biogenesis factor 19-like [Mytilus californianus]